MSDHSYSVDHKMCYEYDCSIVVSCQFDGVPVYVLLDDSVISDDRFCKRVVVRQEDVTSIGTWIDLLDDFDPQFFDAPTGHPGIIPVVAPAPGVAIEQVWKNNRWMSLSEYHQITQNEKLREVEEAIDRVFDAANGPEDVLNCLASLKRGPVCQGSR